MPWQSVNLLNSACSTTESLNMMALQIQLRISIKASQRIQRWTKRWALGCEEFPPDPAWLLLSKTGPLFSTSMYEGRPIENDNISFKVRTEFLHI